MRLSETVFDERQLPDGPVKTLTRKSQLDVGGLPNRTYRVLAEVGQRSKAWVLLQVESRASSSL